MAVSGTSLASLYARIPGAEFVQGTVEAVLAEVEERHPDVSAVGPLRERQRQRLELREKLLVVHVQSYGMSIRHRLTAHGDEPQMNADEKSET